MSSWLSITEYAVKNNLSISTIRRRIKGQTLKYKLEGGKYLILDEGKATQNTKTSTEDVLDFAEKQINEITKLNQEIITEKDTIIINQKKKIQKLQEELSELKMLINLLEKKQSLNI